MWTVGISSIPLSALLRWSIRSGLPFLSKKSLVKSAHALRHKRVLYAAKVEMSVEQSLGRTRSVHVSVEVKGGATWDTARGDSQMLIHIVGRTLKGQTIDEYQYVNSAGDGIELKPGDYELTVDEPPVATDGTRFRASKRMVPVSFNSQAPDTVDTTPQGGFDLYVDTQ